jgi:RNA polymerase sigma-70 factor (sigma-E family)
VVQAVAALDEALVRAAAARFEDEYSLLFAAAYRIAYRLLGDRGDAEDVAQEACARAYSRWSSVRDYARPWCIRVAGNLALDRLRAAERARRHGDDTPRPALDESATTATRLDLHRALDALPSRQRQVVILRYLGDLSERQTADVLGVSVGSVKTHGSRGLARLREVVSR